MTTDAASATGPATHAAAAHNDIPPGFQALYTSDGREILVREADLAAVQADLGLIPIKYDLDAATSNWLSLHDAQRDAVLRSLAEIKALGYQRDESVWIMNEATGNALNAWRHLACAIGALLPTEGTVASLRAHADQHGHVDALPDHLQRLLPLTEGYALPSPPPAPSSPSPSAFP